MSVYACIDLKSFYASVECVERGRDPFTTNLVVADPSRGRGAICLAVTPAMKEQGVKNRCRIFEIPGQIRYITAMPRMKKYMEYSARIYAIYLKFISPSDIQVYSIDECFIDLTPYLALYHKTPKETVVMMMDAVYKETGICATGGIGTNLFLAKVALDITAKHVPDHIGILNQSTFRKKIWHHRPITDIWNIGRGIATRLERYNVHDLYGVAHLDESLLYQEFGKNAEYLIDHAHGVEPCTIADIQAYRPKTASLSNSQILFKDYNARDARLVLKEMVDQLALELVARHLVTDAIDLRVGYSKQVTASTGGSRKLFEATNSYRHLSAAFDTLFEETTRQEFPIRQVGIAFGHLETAGERQMDFFSGVLKDDREERLQQVVVGLKKKYGKNAVLRGMSLQPEATARKRNKLIGGHNGE